MLHIAKTKLKPLSLFVIGLTLSLSSAIYAQDSQSVISNERASLEAQTQSNVSNIPTKTKQADTVYKTKITKINDTQALVEQKTEINSKENPSLNKESESNLSATDTIELPQDPLNFASTPIEGTEEVQTEQETTKIASEVAQDTNTTLSSIQDLPPKDSLNLSISQVEKLKTRNITDPQNFTGEDIESDQSNISNEENEESLSLLMESMEQEEIIEEKAPDSKFGKIAIIYFSQPEKITGNRIDELTAASWVVCRQNHQHGIMYYLSNIIKQQLQDPVTIVNLNPLPPYPKEHEDLIDQASLEIDTKARPRYTLEPHVNLDEFDTFFIGYPIWWYDLPMVFYSLFEHEDFSGKTIIPFCTHGGSQAFNTVNQIKKLEPNANVIEKILAQNRIEVFFSGKDHIRAWLYDLGFTLKEDNNKSEDGCINNKEKLSIQSLRIETNPNRNKDLIKE